MYSKPFLEFWDQYPRKVEKDYSFKQWLRLTEKEKADASKAVQWFKDNEWKDRDKQYIPYPGKFLFRKLWKDFEDSTKGTDPRVVERLADELEARAELIHRDLTRQFERGERQSVPTVDEIFQKLKEKMFGMR